jgi:hypothetical protein
MTRQQKNTISACTKKKNDRIKVLFLYIFKAQALPLAPAAKTGRTGSFLVGAFHIYKRLYIDKIPEILVILVDLEYLYFVDC